MEQATPTPKDDGGPAFEPGSTVYTEDGTECILVGIVEGGAVVQNAMTNDEGEADYGYGRRFFTEKVYPTAPCDKMDASIEQKRRAVLELQERAFALHTEIATAERTRKELLVKIQQVPTLQRLADFLDGKLTHLVYEDYSGVRVGPISAEATDDGGYSRQKTFRLLSLLGRSKGDIGWHLNQYSDGSGSLSTLVHLCTSEEEAKSKASEILAAKFEECRKSPQRSELGYLLASAAKIGIQAPDDLVEWHAQKERETAERLVEEARKLLTEREAMLAARKGAAQ